MHAQADDEVPRKTKKRSSARSSSGDGGPGIPEVMYVLAVVLTVVMAVVFGRWQGALVGAFFAGILLMTVGFYGAVVVAQEAEVWERIVYILVPIYHFIFWAKFWEDTKRYVACYIIGFMTIGASVTIIATMAAQQRHQRQQAEIAARQQLTAAMKAQADQFHAEHQRRFQESINSAAQPPWNPNKPLAAPGLGEIPGMGEPPSNGRLFGDLHAQLQAEQQRNMEMSRQRMEAQRQRLGLPPLVNNSGQQQQPQQAAKSEPKPADVLREMSQPVPLQQLLQISRQVKGKFEPTEGMQLFVKRADGEWYLAEVTEVLGPQKAQVRFAYDRAAADGVVGRDKVRIPNGPWPPFPEVPAEPATETTPAVN